ncbi:DUF2490 domain-containing protein [Aegicerativicinus sediminis]|uniref:DUF2490 domain-containing protein n=1 Tax=Aegicerativicinus sediminis TaxID=2893202 RepID=UPI001E51F5D2|nr:DUF2490 domain-containing protein [Aegicerativicinus sediminis]
MKAPKNTKFSISEHFQRFFRYEKNYNNLRNHAYGSLLVLILSLSNTSLAQEQTISSFSSWNTITFTGKLNSHWTVAGELNLRRTEFSSEWQQIVARPYFDFKLLEGLVGTFGFSYVRNFHCSEYSVPIDATENNLWQQMLWTHKLPKSSLSHRLRFEERFIDKIINTNGDLSFQGTKYVSRIRYRATLYIPLKKFKNKQSLTFVAYDELFFTFEDGKLPETLEQNWVFAGLSYKLNDRCSLKSGYNYTHNESRNNLVLDNHIWSTFLNYQLF